MNSFIEKVKEVFTSLVEKIQQFYEENRKLFFIIVGMLLVIFICLILLVSTGKKEKNKTKEIPGQTLEFTERLYVPDGPALPRDYTASRKTSEKWTTEEAEDYFTIPTEKEINALAVSNENMINEIIGAAP